MGEQLRFAVLGPVRGWRGPDEIDLGPPKQRAVLATLLLGEGAHVPVQTLIDAVWGTGSPGSALSSLRSYVYRLRGVAGPGCRNVRFSGSIRVNGALKIWDGPNCTGNVKVVSGNVQDLSAIGFGTVKSVRFLG